MIDFERLDAAYARDGFYALQLEVGDACNQGCIYCYMNALPVPENTLTDAMVSAIIDDANRLGITAIEWLGGEPLLRDSIFDHMERAANLGFRNNLWTGGLPLQDEGIARKCMALCKHGLISIHASSIDPAVYNTLHPGNPTSDLDAIIAAVRAMIDAGYPPGQMLNSVTFTGLQSAEDMIATIDFFEEELGIATSLNVYHDYLRPGFERRDLARFVPPPAAVAKVYRRMAKQLGQDTIPMNCVNKQYCSATLAVLCDGSVTPCATIRDPGAPNLHSDGSLLDITEEHRDHLLIKQFKVPANLPPTCQSCSLNAACWGCRSRAYASGRGLLGTDPRCFRTKPV